MKKIHTYGFTLIELLVVISIISILFLWASKINFNSLNDKQKIEIFGNKVVSKFETIRNFAIIWKWIWLNLETPEKWKIEFSNSWSWNIKSSYFSWTLANWVKYDEIIFNNNYKIQKIECLNFDESSSINFAWAMLWTWIIEIVWSKLTLTWSCNNPIYKKIKTTIKYKNNFEKNIEINTINWLVKIK